MSNRYWIAVGAIAVVAAVAGMYVARTVSQPAVATLTSGTVLPHPRTLAEFSLTDTRGADTSPRELRGHPTLVFFGFTHCPDVCPTTLALLTSVQKQLAPQNEKMAALKVALISVDPERDTPEQMGKYIASFGGDLIGLTGSAPEIVKATRSFGVAFARADLPGGSYTMDHSATVFVLDSQARIVAVFTPPLSAAALTRDVARLEPSL
ncbi:MAG TPA: SCO family protein [Steroidobacteraceae bacterium]|nr:SCO family protein [Steroidobacteraceae bacterium]